ncbi:uncharacterized protein LOC106178329 isoform X2 [Lingula anatina]|uniref:Uncharacterized protein LOC106178329 isoform X1 n=1 Tax=Lingula anatina TaxID=7574 RepID=A0A1S3K3C3_LINAN|nr:uncharacterized protein LOC106178329 isoform X1 [Lingula anatina]XP_013416919.1 uncharacterized protein LOC106178329 isoform X2 [Lingula anatina]XP_013416920.1 uncharacterized protein LOC106178329 isoform X2 [Lingula anatina]|eukprot:XP_013416918.1 uncharacterized protein LOC106178329 isoform X1 [Lingula anatina]
MATGIIPAPGPPLADTTGTGLWQPCVGPATNSTTSVTFPNTCADGTLCVRNFLFFFFSTYQVCLCPQTTYPDFATRTCLPIQGAPCNASTDCNFLTYDCIGLSSWSIPNDVKEFLTPMVFYICSQIVEYRVLVPNYLCLANSCVFAGVAFGIGEGISGLGRKKRSLSDLNEEELAASKSNATEVWLKAMGTYFEQFGQNGILDENNDPSSTESKATGQWEVDGTAVVEAEMKDRIAEAKEENGKNSSEKSHQISTRSITSSFTGACVVPNLLNTLTELISGQSAEKFLLNCREDDLVANAQTKEL